MLESDDTNVIYVIQVISVTDKDKMCCSVVPRKQKHGAVPSSHYPDTSRYIWLLASQLMSWQHGGGIVVLALQSCVKGKRGTNEGEACRGSMNGETGMNGKASLREKSMHEGEACSGVQRLQQDWRTTHLKKCMRHVVCANH